MGIVTITCDTVGRDSGCSGGFVNGATVGFALLAASFDDPQNARVILLSAAALVLLGLLIAAGTVWWWRSSEVEHPALGPLEVMGSRSWWKGDYALRRRRLEEARPTGAQPVEPTSTPSSEPVDLEAAAMASPPEFDDLFEFPLAADPEPLGLDDDGESADPAVAAAAVEDEPGDVDAPGDGSTAGLPDDNESLDDTVAAAPRPIDPLLRLHHDA